MQERVEVQRKGIKERERGEIEGREERERENTRDDEE